MLHWHFVLMCQSLTFLSHLNSMSFFFLLVFFDEFQQKSYESCGDIMDPRSWESIPGPLVGYRVQLLKYFRGINLLSIEDYAHLLFKGIRLWFHICVLGFVFFIDPFWNSMIFRLKGGPHLL
jgi:hypothetical protein